MKKNYDYGSKSITSWGYVWRNIFYAIPVLGWFIWFTRLFAKNRNIRNHARSYVCAFVLLLIVGIIAAIGVVVAQNVLGIDVLATVKGIIKGFLPA